jgi:hypothetical protein
VAAHRLGAYRAKRDYSLNEVAWKLRELSRAVDGIDSGPTLKTVWRWEQGSTPTARYRRLLCRLYDATAAELGFHLTPAASERQCDAALVSTSACDSPRRELLAAVATIADLLDREHVGGERRLGLADVARLDAVTTLYRSLDYECGGGMLYVEVGRFAEISSGLLDHRCSDGVGVRLLGAVASARQLAGWTAFDAGADCDAQRHWIAAERAAVAAADGRLAARVRYSQARQFQHARHNRDALQTLRLARAQLGADATPAISAMLHGAEASSLAALGDRCGALAALDDASREHERIDPEREPSWMRFYGPGELFAQYGRVYRDLARTDRTQAQAAVRWVSSAIDAFTPASGLARNRLLNEVGLCSALFLAGAPEDAIALADRMIPSAEQMTSARVIDRVRGVRRDLANYRTHPGVSQFAERLDAVCTAASR